MSSHKPIVSRVADPIEKQQFEDIEWGQTEVFVNRRDLLAKYRETGGIVAIYQRKIVADGKSIDEVKKQLDACGCNFHEVAFISIPSIYFMGTTAGSVVMKPDQIKPSARDRILPVIARSQQAFINELPQLLQTHYRQWVAYHNGQRIGFAPTQTRLYRACVQQGFPRTEVLVRCIQPEIPDDIEMLRVV